MVQTLDILKNIKSNTKIQIACWLFKHPNGLTVTRLVELTQCKRTNISKQINEMKKIGLVVFIKKGKYIFYTINKNLHTRQTQMIKEIINAFNIVDKNNLNFKIYK